MKMIVVPVLPAVEASLRQPWLIMRAIKPTVWSPISPSTSARGTSAATESMTTKSMAPDRIRVSAISRACSPLSGCEMSRLSISTPTLAAYDGSRECSASINAQMPPFFCASAMQCSVRVVFPPPSAPKISIKRPLGNPPPSAKSSDSEPVGVVATFICERSPKRMMEPLPNVFSMRAIASLSDFCLSATPLVKIGAILFDSVDLAMCFSVCASVNGANPTPLLSSLESMTPKF